MPNLGALYVFNAKRVRIVRVGGLPTADDIFSRCRMASVVLDSNNFSIKNPYERVKMLERLGQCFHAATYRRADSFVSPYHRHPEKRL